MRVRRDGHAEARGLVDDRGQFVGAEVRAVGIVAGGHHRAARQHLDPVAAVLDLLAHGFAHGIDTVDDETVSHHPVLGAEEVQVPAAARDREVVPGAGQPGTDEQSFLDRRAHIEMRVGHVCVAEDAHRRPAGPQHFLHDVQAAQRLVAGRAPQVIDLVIVGLDQHVGMRVDQARQARVLRAVDHGAIHRACGTGRERAHGHDAAVLDADLHFAFHRGRAAVNQRAAAKCRHAGGGRCQGFRGRARVGGCAKRDEHQRQPGGRCTSIHLQFPFPIRSPDCARLNRT